MEWGEGGFLGMSGTRMNSSMPNCDQLYHAATLRRAWRLVQLGGTAGGVDAINVDQFAKSAGSELHRIAGQLRERRYRFQPVRRVKIDKPGGGQRTLGIPTISDRIVGQAMRLVIEPSLEAQLASASYAYRPDRDVHRAIDKLLEYRRGGYHWCLESDVENFFDSIVHSHLMRLLSQHVNDRRLLELLRQLLQTCASRRGGWFKSARGVPQGSPLSPLLSNLYLDPFDRALARRGHKLIRYADDLVVCCRSRDDAERARRDAARELGLLGLRIHPAKTRVLDSRQSPLEFLGFLVHPHYLWPAPLNVDRLEREIDRLTRPSTGRSLAGLLGELNPLVRSFAHYYRNCQVQGLYERLDTRIRRRLLPHVLRSGRRRPRNLDHWRALKLVSMTEILLSSEPLEPAPALYGSFSGRRNRKLSTRKGGGYHGSGMGKKAPAANNRPPRHRK